MIRPVELFFCALQFLTRLPTPHLARFQPDWIDRCTPFFPVVGWVVGAISAVVWLAAARFWPGLPAAGLAVAVGALVTGGMHEDGLADTADGLGGGQTPERRLEIMKDSRLGSYGALALWSALTIKTGTLSGFDAIRGAVSLVLMHGAARAVSPILMASLRYAGRADDAKWRSGRVRPWEAATAVVLGVSPLPWLIGWTPALVGIGLAACAALALTVVARRLIGGFTGDVLGAVEQLAELGLILGFAVA